MQEHSQVHHKTGNFTPKPVKNLLPLFLLRGQGSKFRLGETSCPSVERMPRLPCTALIVAFAVCNATRLPGNPDHRRFSGETRTVNERASLVPQRSAEGLHCECHFKGKFSSRKNRGFRDAIRPIAHRSGIQIWSACPTWGTQNFSLVLYPSGTRYLPTARFHRM